MPRTLTLLDAFATEIDKHCEKALAFVRRTDTV
jgi:hypothetical protein